MGMLWLSLAPPSFAQGVIRWHADIKPANVLSVQGKFKLADPGFATFVPKKEEFPREFVHGGTETYGKPGITISPLPL